MKNPWTTLPGLVVLIFGLGLIAGAAVGYVDMSIEAAVVLGLVTVPTAIGLLRARQDNVSSERAGAKALLPLAIGAMLVGNVGCQGLGYQARESLLAPAVVAAWPEVRSDAVHGIAARAASGEIGPGVADSRLERVNQFGEAIERLGEPR